MREMDNELEARILGEQEIAIGRRESLNGRERTEHALGKRNLKSVPSHGKTLEQHAFLLWHIVLKLTYLT
jgi:hypothetical protein